jgi:hypothetical protein
MNQFFNNLKGFLQPYAQELAVAIQADVEAEIAKLLNDVLVIVKEKLPPKSKQLKYSDNAEDIKKVIDDKGSVSV